jgi:hypothetical protein
MIVSKRLIAVIVGALAVGLIAGCGGGSDDSSGSGSGGSGGEISTGSLNKTEFVKLATAICDKQHQKIEGELAAYVKARGGLSKATKAPGTSSAIGETIVIPTYKAEVEEFRALGAPSGSEDEIEAILAAFEEGIEVSEKLAAKNEGTTSPKILKANALAHKFGLKTCMTF